MSCGKKPRKISNEEEGRVLMGSLLFFLKKQAVNVIHTKGGFAIMTGYIYALSDKESRVTPINWKQIKANKSKWISFSFEESSIDMGLNCEPRYVINDIVYTPYKQYFIKEGSNTVRLVVAIESPPSEQGTS